MRIRRRTANVSGLRSNPFVVMTDMTIGLAFFFAVFSVVAALANSKAVQLMERQNRQKAVCDDIVSAVTGAFPSAISQPGESATGEKYTEIVTRDKKTSLVEIWENGNFQRLKVYAPAFPSPRGHTLSADGRGLYKDLGAVIKKHASEFSYLFLHGIVEPTEVESSLQGRSAALDVSRKRADEVYALMTELRVIASAGETETPPDCIPRKYAISYGTGVDLYTRVLPKKEKWNTGSPIGRVDLVFFYKEEAGDGGSKLSH